jgi:hypothetical protein
MILALVRFALPDPIDLAEATRRFESSAPKYLGLPGLMRKHYVLSDDGRFAGGVYLWESRAAAEAVYSGEWVARVAALYGAEPEILFFASPVTVDNGTGTIGTGP